MNGFFLRQCVLTTAFLAWGLHASAEPSATPPSAIYEVIINGESFLVEGDRATKLESKEKPGVRYEVAIRLAQSQRLRLNSFQIDYDLPAKIQDDGNRENRWVQIVHELGFTLLLNDLGKPQKADDHKKQGKDDGQEELALLVKSVADTLRKEAKENKLDIGDPHDQAFAQSSAHGVTIRYHDSRDFEHVCLVYMLSGATFRATCVVEYLENDSDDVLPLIKKTLDSVQPVAKQG